jgi:hypothetical protein
MMKTHKELVAAVQVLTGHCNTLETFGTKTFGFIEWRSMAYRKMGETVLKIGGFIVNEDYSPGRPYSSVQVDTATARKLKNFDRHEPYNIKGRKAKNEWVYSKIDI